MPHVKRCGVRVGRLSVKLGAVLAGVRLPDRVQSSKEPLMTKPLYERCMDQHRAVGTIGYPRPFLRGYEGPHASVRTCGAAACLASANRYIRGITGHDGVFRTFEESRAGAA